MSKLKNALALILGFGSAWLFAEAILMFLFPPPPRYIEPQPRHRPDPVLGWTLQPGQKGYTVDQPLTVNALGFRSPEIRVEKPPTLLRVLCLGDSQTFGNGVHQDRTYPAILQEILSSKTGGNRVEVINAGVQGYDTVQEVALLEQAAQSLHPDIVTIGFYLNDIAEARRTNRSETVVGETGEFHRRGLRRLTPYRFIHIAKRSRLVTFLRHRFRMLIDGGRANLENHVLRGEDPPQYEEGWRVIESELTRARGLSLKYGFRLVVFPVPALADIVQRDPRERYRSRLQALGTRLGIESHDPTHDILALGGDPERFFIPWDGHMSSDGHRAVAEALARIIGPGRIAESTSSIMRDASTRP